jgi:hypothetical protein
MNFIWDNTAPPVYIAPVNYQQAPKEIIDYNIAPIKTESPQSYTKAGDLPVQQKSENQSVLKGVVAGVSVFTLLEIARVLIFGF